MKITTEELAQHCETIGVGPIGREWLRLSAERLRELEDEKIKREMAEAFLQEIGRKLDHDVAAVKALFAEPDQCKAALAKAEQERDALREDAERWRFTQTDGYWESHYDRFGIMEYQT